MNEFSSNNFGWDFQFNGLAHDRINWNFGKFSEWVFQNLAIRIDQAGIFRLDMIVLTHALGRFSAAAYIKSIMNLLKDISFVLLLLSYGLNVGVYYAISTLLNPILKPTFHDPDNDIAHSVNHWSVIRMSFYF